MFFAISGFLFFTVYFNRFMSGKLNIGDFIKKKILSFYPIIIITTIFLYFLYSINYLVTGIIVDDEDLSPFRLMTSLLFGSPNSICNFPPGYNLPLWFLFALMISFAVACWLTSNVIKHKDNNRYLALYLIPIAVGIIMYGLLRTEHPLVFWNEDIPIAFVSFFIGFYLGLYIDRFKKYNARKKLLIRISTLAWLVFFIYLTIKTNNDIPALDLLLPFSIFFWPELILLCYDIKWLNVFCGFRAIKFLGYISLFIFVLNYPIIKTIKVFGGFKYFQTIDGWLVILILVIVHIVFATIWYIC